MCGLVAVITKNTTGFSNEQREVFKTLLYLDNMRGKDSAGVFVVSNMGNVKMAKQASTADAFLNTPEFEELYKNAWDNGFAMVGHNRAATRGEINDTNAHPFVVDDKIVLVHNGTFHGDHKKLKDTAVDSEAIAHMLSENDDVETAMRQVNAAYALIWYNVETKKLSLLRNSQRPLVYMETKDAYYIASEHLFLEFARARHRLIVEKDKGPYELKENNIVEFELLDNKRCNLNNIPVDVDYYKHNKTVVETSVYGGGTALGAHGFRGAYYDPEWDNDNAPFVMGKANDAVVTPSQLKDSYPAWGTRDAAKQKIVIDALGKKFNPVTNKQWIDMMSGPYNGKKKLKVVVTDLVEADDNPKTKNYLMLGHTLDDNELNVVFPFTSADWNTIIEKSDNTVFEIDLVTVTWQEVPAYPQAKDVPVQDKIGLALLHGINPVCVIPHGEAMCLN